jgi:DNA mismatch endonuclease, patch repair protein
VDVHTPEQRRRNMAAIRYKNTKPEIVVRKLLSEMGIHYRLHRKDLPGKPDIVMPGRKVAIFVQGCFWHMHRCRYGRVIPATNREFWQKKREGNVERDTRTQKKLRRERWHVLNVWECWTKDPENLKRRLFAFLSKYNSTEKSLSKKSCS